MNKSVTNAVLPRSHGGRIDPQIKELFGSQLCRIEENPDNPDAAILHFVDGGAMPYSEIDRVIPCFTPGTKVATPKGEVDVARLKLGDRVLTRDNGIQTITWLGQKRLDYLQLKRFKQLRPILIKAGALGNQTPERDMTVSPTHRMLVVSDVAQMYFDQSEVLVSAKHLLELDGVEVDQTPYVTYIHFMCAHHEIVLADGTWSESFQPGDYSLRGLDEEQREELFALFPELASQEGVKTYRAARRSLQKDEARLVIGS